MAKNSYRVVAVCSNANHRGRYTFIENYDDDWSSIAEDMFYDEFGEDPTECEIEDRELI